MSRMCPATKSVLHSSSNPVRSNHSDEGYIFFAASWQSEHTSPISVSGLSGEMMQPPKGMDQSPW